MNSDRQRHLDTKTDRKTVRQTYRQINRLSQTIIHQDRQRDIDRQKQILKRVEFMNLNIQTDRKTDR